MDEALGFKNEKNRVQSSRARLMSIMADAIVNPVGIDQLTLSCPDCNLRLLG